MINFRPPHQDARPGYPQPGAMLCRWCHGPIVKGHNRRTTCSKLCADSLLFVLQPARRRTVILLRDKQCCVLCGLNVVEAWRWWNRIIQWERRTSPGRSWRSERTPTVRAFESLWRPGERKSLFECDHITPRVRGGANTPDNLRTLCLDCHRSETARLAAERAAERKSPMKTAPRRSP